MDSNNIKNKIIELEVKEIEFNDRKKLKLLLDKIELYIKSCQWIKKAENSRITTNSITNKQKEIFTKYITNDYIESFNIECAKLNAEFQVEIKQRGSKGVTLKKLALKGKTPASILSEGEQRALSLANFLTEIKISNNNICAIFDDPVNSLDHKRRRIIAERLIAESKVRQVVAFTHDITFLMELKEISENETINLHFETIRNIRNTPGIISAIIPCPAMNVKDRIKILNSEIDN